MKLKTIFLIYFLILTLDCVSSMIRKHRKSNSLEKSELEGRVRNIQYLSFTYDIYYGNPEPTEGFDPGFKTIPIFDFQYNANSGYDDEFPDKVIVTNQNVCNLDMDSTTIKDTASYTNKLKTSVSVEGGYGPATFSASVDYQSVEEGTTSKSNTYIINSGRCSIRMASVNTNFLPAVNSNFLSEVKQLPSSYSSAANKAKYMTFLETHGTHFLQQMEMGGKFSLISKISEDAIKKMNSEKVSVSAAAKFSGKITIGVSSLNEVEKSQAKTFETLRTSSKHVTVGSYPPSDGSSVTWANSLFANPMPISYSLQSLSKLFNANFMPKIKDIAQRKTNIEKALGEYCEHLKKKGAVKTCVESQIAEVAAVPASCRFCAGGCGGSFTEDGGSMGVDTDWTNFFSAYDRNCGDSMYSRSFPKGIENNGGIHLCCQPESKARTGSCKICTSCSGEYPAKEGAFMCDNSGWSGWNTAFDNGCRGARTGRSNPGDGIKLCCKSKPICTFCDSCGGEWPEENGVFSKDQNWYGFSKLRGNECSGDMQNRDKSDGVSLCCKTRGE